MIPTGILDNPMQNSFHPVIRGTARLVSYVFHPLFLPLYVGLFLIYELRLFPGHTAWQQKIILIQFFLYYTFLPLFVTLLCKFLGFIDSFYLRTQKDRIIPFILCEVFYFWSWYVFRNLDVPDQVVMFALAVFLATSAGLIMNAFMKVSMHALSMGVLAAFMVLAGMMSEVSFGNYITIAFFIAGLTLTARFIDSDHTPGEVYAGFFVGVIAQLVAWLFV